MYKNAWCALMWHNVRFSLQMKYNKQAYEDNIEQKRI